MEGFVSKNNQLPTKSHDELKDNSKIKFKLFVISNLLMIYMLFQKRFGLMVETYYRSTIAGSCN